MTNDTKLILQKMDEVRDDLRNELLTVMGTIRDDLQRQITSINLTLENDIKRSINLIAEGHLDLSRKLDEALTVEREKEMFLVRFNTVENDVRILKAQVAQLI